MTKFQPINDKTLWITLLVKTKVRGDKPLNKIMINPRFLLFKEV